MPEPMSVNEAPSAAKMGAGAGLLVQVPVEIFNFEKELRGKVLPLAIRAVWDVLGVVALHIIPNGSHTAVPV
jgi:hypothetical protein